MAGDPVAKDSGELFEYLDDYMTCAYHDVVDYVTRELPFPSTYDPAWGIFNYSDSDGLFKWYALLAALGVHTEELPHEYPATARYMEMTGVFLDTDVHSLARTEEDTVAVEDADAVAATLLRRARDPGARTGLGEIVRHWGPEGMQEMLRVGLLRNWLMQRSATA